MKNEDIITHHIDKALSVRKVIPLSPVETYEELNETTKGDYRIYEKYLSEALCNSRIRNIAVSGNFGVGKSSILRVYESENGSKARWLHVSMGNFRETKQALEQQRGQTSQERMKNQKDLEIDLLRQITAKCRNKDIPRSSFKLVPAQESKKDRIFAFVVPIVLALLVVGIFAIASDFISTIVYNALFVAIALLSSIILGYIAFCIYPKLRFNGFSLKTNHAELSADSIQPDSYLEQHCFELVYVLESLVRKKQSDIVVFEDMDRLNIDMSIAVFSKLREINALVNNRLDGTGKKLVFIYVVHDKLMSCIKMEKFFDYILSVVPIKCRNVKCECNSSVRLREILEMKFANICDKNVQKMIDVIGTNFNDFRMIYTVINDYRIFAEIGKRHGNFDVDEGKLDPSLFAFLIFKNLRPADYYEICRTGNIPVEWLQNLPEDQKLLLKLNQHGFLTEKCLKYIGC